MPHTIAVVYERLCFLTPCSVPFFNKVTALVFIIFLTALFDIADTFLTKLRILLG